jgi:hypothetical protein
MFIELANETEKGRSGHDGGVSWRPNQSIGSGGSRTHDTETDDDDLKFSLEQAESWV